MVFHIFLKHIFQPFNTFLAYFTISHLYTFLKHYISVNNNFISYCNVVNIFFLIQTISTFHHLNHFQIHIILNNKHFITIIITFPPPPTSRYIHFIIQCVIINNSFKIFTMVQITVTNCNYISLKKLQFYKNALQTCQN